jgi:hypothetical protein
LKLSITSALTKVAGSKRQPIAHTRTEFIPFARILSPHRNNIDHLEKLTKNNVRAFHSDNG